MKIVFDVSSCAKTRRKGIANYGVQLVRACAAVAPEHDIGLAVRGHRWLKKGLVDDILPGRKVHLLTDLLGGATWARPTWCTAWACGCRSAAPSPRPSRCTT